MKRVYTASNLPEAHLLVDHLADHGIRVRVLNANASSLAGELPIDASLPQLWVDEDRHVTRARELIDGYLRASTSGPPRKCARCGEDNPPAFEVCWACGTPL
jgi:hypothetical protein